MNLRSTALALSFLLPTAAMAADLGAAPSVYAPVPSSEWIVTLTGNVQFAPRYPGADESSAFFYPGVGIRKAGEPERFAAPDDGISFAVIENRWLRFGPVARIEGGRYFDDNRQLFGFRDVRWTVEVGAFLEVWPVEWLRARVEARRGLRGDYGFTGNAGLDVVLPYGPWTFSVGPRLAWGDSDYTRTWFGVTPIEAANNGRVPAFRPDGGITSIGALAAVTYKWSPTWSTTVYGGYNRLTDDAEDSPITRRPFGDRDQYIAGVSLSYSFNMAPFW